MSRHKLGPRKLGPIALDRNRVHDWPVMDPFLISEDEFIAAFQERLQRARKARDMSQLEVATGLGLKKSTYKKYETRRGSAFPLYLLPRLSVVLGRPIEYWVYGSDVPGRRLRVIK